MQICKHCWSEYCCKNSKSNNGFFDTNPLWELNVRNLFKRTYKNLEKVKSEDTQNVHTNKENVVPWE